MTSPKEFERWKEQLSMYLVLRGLLQNISPMKRWHSRRGAGWSADAKTEWCDQLWEKVIEKLDLDVKITNPQGRPYIYFMSKANKVFSYVLGYSVRYGSTTVSIETYQGEIIRDELNRFIADNDIISKIPNLKMNHGIKNKEKWAWSVSDTLDKSYDELVDWFVNTLLLFYQSFEHNLWIFYDIWL